MRVVARISWFAVVACLLSAPAYAGSAQSKIEAALKVFTNAFNAGDAATVAGLYTPNAILLPPGARRRWLAGT